MNTTQLQRFVAIAEHLHFPRAAAALGIPLASLYTSLDKLEAELGHSLVNRDKPTSLTPAGTALLRDAPRLLAEAPEPERARGAAGGGKAKASKGKGRAPIVKGQPKPYKKRQGR